MNLLSSLILLGSLALALGCRCAPNIARNGEASQGSVYPHKIMGHAEKAIDGVKDKDFHSGSCTHTNLMNNPWWKLNLKKTYKISNVVLTNRGDCCQERLVGAELRVGNDPDNNNPVCGMVTDVTDAELSFCCNGMVGQYISVVIPGFSEYLSLCEVEVYGNLVEEVIDEEVIDQKVIDKEVIDEEVIDEEVIDQKVINKEVIDQKKRKFVT